jgi:hypothetical protein
MEGRGDQVQRSEDNMGGTSRYFQGCHPGFFSWNRSRARTAKTGLKE